MEPFISMRIGADQQSVYNNISEFADMFQKNPGSCDEVWFSTYYGYAKKEDHKKMAENLLEPAEYVRSKGITVSLQLSNTIGHGSTNRFRDYSGMDWDSIVDADGTVSKFCSCPRDKRFLEYIYETTKYYSILKPEYIWIDDDIRMDNHRPVRHGCFCDRCMNEFNKLHDSSFSREELTEQINTSPEWRQRFVHFNQLAAADIVETVCNAMKAESPDTIIGIQMASFAIITYNGNDFRLLFERVEEISGKPAAIRPGGGFYDDHKPRDMFKKAFKMASAWRNLPDGITVMKAEIENTPHSYSGKSVYGTLMESAADLAFGCTSLSYSAFMRQNESIDFYGNFFKGLSKWRNFLYGYAKINEGMINGGAGILFSATHNKINSTSLWDWNGFKGIDIYDMISCGIPVAWDFGRSRAVLLHHSEVDALSDEELRDIFSRGVVTDGLTVQKLNERGLGGILNIRTEPIDNVEYCDMCSEHPLNGEFAGRVWHDYFPNEDKFNPMFLYPGNETAQVIGNYVKADTKTDVAGISSLIQETSLGGKAAVFTYDPWPRHPNSSYRHLILGALDWVSDNTMPVRLKTPAQAAVIPRVNNEGRLVSVMIINAGIEDSPELDIIIRNPAGDSISWIQPEKDAITLKSEPAENGIRLSIPSIRGWALGYISISGIPSR